MNNAYKGIWEGIVFFAVLILDRITKYYALSCLDVPCQINKNLSFVLHFNRGVSWGILHSESTLVSAFVMCLIVALIGALGLYTAIRWMNHYCILGELMVLAGALSNMIDRFLYKGVVDFIFLSGSGWSWPVFNIADICIVSGVGIIFITGWQE